MKLSTSSIHVILFVCAILVLGSCSTEYEPEPSKSDLKFFPYGETNYVSSVHVLDDRNSFTSINNAELMTIKGEDAEQQWVGNGTFRHLGACELKGRGYMQVSDRYYDQSLSFSVFTNEGNLEYELGTVERLFPEYWQYREILASVQSDGEGGAYLLVVLADEWRFFKNFIVHIDNQNQIESKVELSGFQRYMVVDDEGSIFLIRTYSGSGQNMRFAAAAVDMFLLKTEQKIQYKWQSLYSTPEVDWKWIDYFPYQFYCYDGSLFFVTTQFPDFGDICSGVDIYEFSKTDGSEIRKTSAQFDFLVDNYRNRPTYYLFAGKEGMYLAMNYLNNSKISIFNRLGEFQKEVPISSKTNRTFIAGIGPNGDRLMIHGGSTLNKSADMHPMLYFMDRL